MYPGLVPDTQQLAEQVGWVVRCAAAGFSGSKVSAIFSHQEVFRKSNWRGNNQ